MALNDADLLLLKKGDLVSVRSEPFCAQEAIKHGWSLPWVSSTMDVFLGTVQSVYRASLTYGVCIETAAFRLWVPAYMVERVADLPSGVPTTVNMLLL